ncbi:hypothetical protein GCM10009624_20550 [Gordonia sinesedis]
MAYSRTAVTGVQRRFVPAPRPRSDDGSATQFEAEPGVVAQFADGPDDAAKTRARTPRPGERQRFRRLAQAALNADVTVEQVDTILTEMGTALTGLDTTLGGLDDTIERLDVTLERLSGTLDQVDLTVQRMADVVARLEGVVSRVENMVAIGEKALRPLGTIEDVARTVLARLGLRR